MSLTLNKKKLKLIQNLEMASKIDLEYIYQDIDNQANFQLVIEDIANQLIRYHNDENQEVVAWFLA